MKPKYDNSIMKLHKHGTEGNSLAIPHQPMENPRGCLVSRLTTTRLEFNRSISITFFFFFFQVLLPDLTLRFGGRCVFSRAGGHHADGLSVQSIRSWVPPWKITELSSRAERKPNRSLTSDIDYTPVFPCLALIRKRFPSWLRNKKESQK